METFFHDSRYTNLDKDLTTLDLREIFKLEKIELNDNAQIKQLTVSLRNWILIKDMKQFKNLEYLTIQSKYDNEDSLEDIEIIDFGIHPNLIKLYINDGDENTNKILFTNLTKLKELTLTYNSSYQEDLDFKDCINLKKLNLFFDEQDSVLIINQPSIEILTITGMFLDGINLNNLINLKELYLIGIESDLIDLKGNKKLIKIVVENSVCSFENVNENIEYIDVDSYEEHGRNLIIIPKEEIENMTKLKYLKINYFLVNNLDLIKLTKLEILYYYSWNNIKNINPGIKILFLHYLDDDISDENDHDEYDETYQNLNKEIEKLVNLEELSLYGWLMPKLNLFNLSKLENINLTDFPYLNELILPYNINSTKVYITNCPNLINKVISRRRIYLLSENGTRNGLSENYTHKGLSETSTKEANHIICKKCNKIINIYNMINMHVRENIYNSKNIINSCC